MKPIAPDKLQSVVNARVRSSIREQGKVGVDGKPITPARTPYGHGSIIISFSKLYINIPNIVVRK